MFYDWYSDWVANHSVLPESAAEIFRKEQREAETRMRAPMACRHPRACEDESATVSTSFIGVHGETIVSGCSACERERQTVAQTEARLQRELIDPLAKKCRELEEARDYNAELVEQAVAQREHYVNLLAEEVSLNNALQAKLAKTAAPQPELKE